MGLGFDGTQERSGVGFEGQGCVGCGVWECGVLGGCVGGGGGGVVWSGGANIGVRATSSTSTVSPPRK